MASDDRMPGGRRPNFIIMCMDQWDAHMELPANLRLPAMERMEERGVTFEKQYCTVPMCTASRAAMWTGVHAKNTGLWDNLNFSWIHELSPDVPTIGHMLREQGYYTAFKGKWHLSDVPMSEDALERYGFADFQAWGEMFGTPLQGAMLDGTVAFETVDWLRHRAPKDQPWFLISSMVNPHDVMYMRTEPFIPPRENGTMKRAVHLPQTLGIFEEWDVTYPPNFDDDLSGQPPGVTSYRNNIEWNYGAVPDDRPDLWLQRRNYLLNCLRLVDQEFGKVLDEIERQGLWDNTVVILTSDHGEMNGAHRLAQKGGIHYEEAAVVNMSVAVPGGPAGTRTRAVGSHLDLAPTVLELAGLSQEDIARRYPQLRGRSLAEVLHDPDVPGPRGSIDEPGAGALLCWDGLFMLDAEWSVSGALRSMVDLPHDRRDASLLEAGEKYGAPDFSLRTFYRAVVDGRYKLVRWFSPEDYETPRDVDDLLSRSDLSLHDLWKDPGELVNLADPTRVEFDRGLVATLLDKLNALIDWELGDDSCPFDLDMFGTRELVYTRTSEAATRTS
ncbi:sulfatase-like hydrolase/transferase [Georgenia yuyongxinii]|nr:sulfatase-like hydrolase/transferase [Georgenia yuyongxinii]